MTLDQATLLSVFEYKDGVLYRRKNGKKAGTLHHTGYIQISHQRTSQNAHRMIFLMHHGWLPEVIDHIDGNRANNKIENLRPASWRQNLQNMQLRPTNKSGCKNVSWCNTKRKWAVQLSINGRQTNLGRFDDLELADLVATEARIKYHGAFARHL
jgi:hypothetical protein